MVTDAKKLKKIKVCYILAYKSPNYIRTLALVDMLKACDDIELFEVRNTTKGFLRYAQTLAKLVACRIKYRPHIYILGFRGYEIFLPARLLTVGRPLIYDEFINLYDWFILEHKKFDNKSIFARVIKFYSKITLKLSARVLTDTKLNAAFSTRLHNITKDKFVSVYVGTDESTFKPVPAGQNLNKPLEVFFYGTMLPLHGLEVILEAIEKLKDKPIHFTIVGGKGTQYESKMNRYIDNKNLKNLTYKNWVEYKELPKLIADADVCLGGPFGDTSQSSKVITGKTFQFLAMAKLTLIGKISEETGFKDEDNCLIIRQGSSEQLASKIKWALENRDKLAKIGKQGRSLYEQKFSQRAQKNTLDKTIQDLVD